MKQQMVYLQKQHVKLGQWVGEEEPPREEDYDRLALVFLDIESTPTAWCRRIDERLVDEASLDAMRAEDTWSRAELDEHHDELAAQHAIEFGLDAPLELASGPLGLRRPAPEGSGAAAPALSPAALCLPTVIPARPVEGWTTGARHEGEELVELRGSAFPVRYEVSVADAGAAVVELALELPEQSPSVEGEEAVVWLGIAGTTRLTLGAENSVPLAASGRLDFEYRMRFRNLRFEEIETWIERASITFEYEPVPIVADASHLHLSGWKR